MKKGSVNFNKNIPNITNNYIIIFIVVKLSFFYKEYLIPSIIKINNKASNYFYIL